MKAGGMGNLLFCKRRKCWRGEGYRWAGQLTRDKSPSKGTMTGWGKWPQQVSAVSLSFTHCSSPCYPPSPCSNLQWPRIHKSPETAQDGHKHPHACRYDPGVENTGEELWGVGQSVTHGSAFSPNLVLAELTLMPHSPEAPSRPHLLNNGASSI